MKQIYYYVYEKNGVINYEEFDTTQIDDMGYVISDTIEAHRSELLTVFEMNRMYQKCTICGKELKLKKFRRSRHKKQFISYCKECEQDAKAIRKTTKNDPKFTQQPHLMERFVKIEDKVYRLKGYINDKTGEFVFDKDTSIPYNANTIHGITWLKTQKFACSICGEEESYANAVWNGNRVLTRCKDCRSEMMRKYNKNRKEK